MVEYTDPKTNWVDGDNVGDTGRVLNRIEKNIEYEHGKAVAILTKDFELSGDKTVQDGVKVDAINEYSGTGLSVEGVKVSTNKTFNTASQEIEFSAADRNNVHLNSKGDQVYYDWFYADDATATLYSHYKYSVGINSYKFITVAASNAGRGGTTDCTIYVTDGDAPNVSNAHITINADGSGLGLGELRYYYANLPSEAPTYLKIWQVIGGTAAGGGSTIFPRGADIWVRRCKYPIQPGNPVKVYSSDFSTTQKRAITATDISKNRLSS